MIRPIKQNIAFQGVSIPPIYQNVAKTSSVCVPAPQVQETIEQFEQQNTEEKDKKEKPQGNIFHRAKIGIMNIIKGFNNVTDTASGIIKGIGEGLAAGVAVGTVGANFVKSKKQIAQEIENAIKPAAEEAAEATKKVVKNVENYPVVKLLWKTVSGTVVDVSKSIFNAFKYIPKIFSQEPKATFKAIGKLPARFVKYMNESTGGKKLTVLTSLIAVGFIAFRAIEGKIKANKKNAEVDHALNEGHNPTK